MASSSRYCGATRLKNEPEIFLCTASWRMALSAMLFSHGMPSCVRNMKRLLPVAFKPLLEYPHRFRRVFPSDDVLIVEPLDNFEELPQVPGLQPIAIDLLENRHEQ